MPRINNTIHRNVFVCHGQKSSSNRCKIHYHTIPNAPICCVLPHVAHTENNAIMIFYLSNFYNRSQKVVHALREDAICHVLHRFALLCIFGGRFAVAHEKYFHHFFINLQKSEDRGCDWFSDFPFFRTSPDTNTAAYRSVSFCGNAALMRQLYPITPRLFFLSFTQFYRMEEICE